MRHRAVCHMDRMSSTWGCDKCVHLHPVRPILYDGVWYGNQDGYVPVQPMRQISVEWVGWSEEPCVDVDVDVLQDHTATKDPRVPDIDQRRGGEGQ